MHEEVTVPQSEVLSPVVVPEPPTEAVASPPATAEPTTDQKFNTLFTESADFKRDTDLLDKLKVLFDKGDPSQTAEQRSQAEQLLNERYAEHTDSKSPVPPPVSSEPTPSRPSAAPVEQAPTPPAATKQESILKATLERRKRKANLQSLANIYQAVKPGQGEVTLSDDDVRLSQQEVRLKSDLPVLLERHTSKLTSTNDPYVRLNIPRDADEKAIKAAYRQQVKLFHPDNISDVAPELVAQAQQAFNALTEAYEVLSDKAKKASYDRDGGARKEETIVAKPPRAQNLHTYVENIIVGMEGIWVDPITGVSKTSSARRPTPESAAQERVAKIKRAERKISDASTISEIKDGLRELNQLGHQLEIPSTANNRTPEKISPTEINTKVDEAFDAMFATREIYQASIDALPRHLNIRQTVDKEIRVRRSAMEILSDPKASELKIRSALNRLAEIDPQFGVIIGGERQRINLVDNLATLSDIAMHSFDITKVNELIVKVTPWRDIDLKVYYDVRSRYISSEQVNAPIPPQIRERYLAYKAKRDS